MRFIRIRHSILFIVAMLAAGTIGTVSAQDAPTDGDIRMLRIGQSLSELPTDGYYEFACGSNGGPPLRPIRSWSAFRDCRPEANGLYEVYVEYDSEALAITELYRQTFGEAMWLEKYAGTKVAGHPVILSVLFGSDEIVHGLRVVTDSRAPIDRRVIAHTLRFRVKGRYRRAKWECIDLPLADGEKPVGEKHMKERCEAEYQGRRIVLESHFYRKAGQTGLDDQGQFKEGDFESSTRWEIWNPLISVN